jgi:hypothetical protein
MTWELRHLEHVFGDAAEVHAIPLLVDVIAAEQSGDVHKTKVRQR